MRNIGFKLGGAFLVLGDDAGYPLQSVDEVHAGGMGVAHGDEAVVELVFVVAFNHKSVLNSLFAVNECALRDYAYREAIDLADALVLTVGVGTLRQPLQVDTHVLLVGEVTGVDGEIVKRIAVLVSPDD